MAGIEQIISAVRITAIAAIILKKKIYLIKKQKFVLNLFTNVNECIIIGL